MRSAMVDEETSVEVFREMAPARAWIDLPQPPIGAPNCGWSHSLILLS